MEYHENCQHHSHAIWNIQTYILSWVLSITGSLAYSRTRQYKYYKLNILEMCLQVCLYVFFRAKVSSFVDKQELNGNSIRKWISEQHKWNNTFKIVDMSWHGFCRTTNSLFYDSSMWVSMFIAVFLPVLLFQQAAMFFVTHKMATYYRSFFFDFPKLSVKYEKRQWKIWAIPLHPVR